LSSLIYEERRAAGTRSVGAGDLLVRDEREELVVGQSLTASEER
jgi:hypothetical protein